MIRTNAYARIQGFLALVLSVSLPALGWANITNTATATYGDTAGNTYTATSLAVITVTPPVITSAATASGNLGVALTPYTITATNNPTSYAATGLPAGLSLNAATGVISGTPGASGTFTPSLTATNAAGSSAAFILTVTIQGTSNVTLTKTADKTTATSGTVVTYTIQYQNIGSGNATNLVIKDIIPTGTTFVAGSITAGGTLSAGTITWTIGTVSAGAPSASVSFKVTVN